MMLLIDWISGNNTTDDYLSFMRRFIICLVTPISKNHCETTTRFEFFDVAIAR